jgi:hypothetical protein
MLSVVLATPPSPPTPLLTQGGTADDNPPAGDAPVASCHPPRPAPRSVIAFDLLSFFVQLPTASLTQTQTVPARGRSKAYGGARKIYRSKLCYEP